MACFHTVLSSLTKSLASLVVSRGLMTMTDGHKATNGDSDSKVTADSFDKYFQRTLVHGSLQLQRHWQHVVRSNDN